MRIPRPTASSCLLAALLCAAGTARSEEIKVTLLQLNDVYEITPLDQEATGKLVRVAALRNSLKRQNPNTFTLMAGDFVSPSALGNAIYEGEALRGRQMISVLNVLGLDYATFGNHEFDITRDQLLRRIGESTFRWTCANVTNRLGEPFPGVSRNLVLDVAGEGEVPFRIAIIGLTIDSNRDADFVRYEDVVASARREAEALRGRYDALIALTHLSLASDMALAAAVPAIDLILGGHEHEHSYTPVATSRHLTPIAKADANARTVYVHQLQFDTDTRHLRIESTLRDVAAMTEVDGRTLRLADFWKGEAFNDLTSLARARPDATAFKTDVPLDGREESVRTGRTNLSAMIVQSLREAVPGGADLAMLNSGSIRLDDVIHPGEVKVYDFLRVLPYPGGIFAAKMKGELVRELLTRGAELMKQGGFLPLANASPGEEKGSWRIGDAPLDPSRTYTVAINDYLLDGRELSFGATDSSRKDLNAELKALRLLPVADRPAKVADLQPTVLAYLQHHAPFKAEFLATLNLPKPEAAPVGKTPADRLRDFEPRVVTFLTPDPRPTPLNIPLPEPGPPPPRPIIGRSWWPWERLNNLPGPLIGIGTLLAVQVALGLLWWAARSVRMAGHRRRELAEAGSLLAMELDRILGRSGPSEAGLPDQPGRPGPGRPTRRRASRPGKATDWQGKFDEIAGLSDMGTLREDWDRLFSLVDAVSARAAIVQAWLRLEQAILAGAVDESPSLDRLTNLLISRGFLAADTVGAIHRLRRLRDQANDFQFRPSAHQARTFIYLLFLVLVHLPAPRGRSVADGPTPRLRSARASE